MDNVTSYDDDIYAWAFQQADLLRQMAGSRRDLPNGLDVENICEEIEGVARTELREAESLLRQLFVHLLKLASAPGVRSERHWGTEAEVFQDGFARAATRTILRKVRTGTVWTLALRQAADQLELEGDAILPGLPAECPLTLDELAAETFDLDAAVGRLRQSASAQPAP